MISAVGFGISGNWLSVLLRHLAWRDLAVCVGHHGFCECVDPSTARTWELLADDGGYFTGAELIDPSVQFPALFFIYRHYDPSFGAGLHCGSRSAL